MPESYNGSHSFSEGDRKNMTVETKYDLVLKNGHLIDPGQNINSKMDIGFKNGEVLSVEDRIDQALAGTVVDIVGKVITPG